MNCIRNKRVISESQIKLYWICGILIIVVTNIIDRSFSPDYYAYVSYLKVDDIFLEPTFRLLKNVTNIIFGGDAYYLFLFYSVIGITIKLYSIPRLTYLIFISLFLYICSYWIYHDLIQIRAGVASGILLYSIPYLVNRDTSKYFLCVFVALLFHYSSIVFLPLWFIKSKSTSKYMYMGLIPFSMLLYLINMDILNILKLIPIDFIQNKIVGYTEISNDLAQRGVVDAQSYNPFGGWYMLKAIMCMAIWMNIDRIRKKNPYALVMAKIFAIGMSLLWLMSGAPVVATRLSELLTIVQIVLVPMLIYSRLPKYLSYSIVVIYGCVWLFWNYSSFMKNI